VQSAFLRVSCLKQLFLCLFLPSMRIEKDPIGEVSLPKEALYGIHSYRARENFPAPIPFPEEWYRATGTVKLACYLTLSKLRIALQKEHPDMITPLRLPEERILAALAAAATAVSGGSHFDQFIVPGYTGGRRYKHQSQSQ
jgi:aspartate ammonia-lyase